MIKILRGRVLNEIFSFAYVPWFMQAFSMSNLVIYVFLSTLLLKSLNLVYRLSFFFGLHLFLCLHPPTHLSQTKTDR